MPELPEVETIVRELRRAIVGLRLRELTIFDKSRIPALRAKLPLDVLSVSRHGKYIVWQTKTGRFLLHLRMTGELQLSQVSGRAKREKHERAKFYFTNGSTIGFLDPRRFGTIEWLQHDDTLPELGIEPLSPKFNEKFLYRITRSSSRVIKSFLMDQGRIAGVGNIYADEALWIARILPTRKSRLLSPKDAGRLVLALKKVLREGIKKGGFTLRDYHRLDGSSGYYQKSRKAYDREGKPCLRCGTKIRRIKVGGRSSYFCPRCAR